MNTYEVFFVLNGKRIFTYVEASTTKDAEQQIKENFSLPTSVDIQLKIISEE